MLHANNAVQAAVDVHDCATDQEDSNLVIAGSTPIADQMHRCWPRSASRAIVPRQVERLYTGPQTDSELVEHMKACNAKGPLVVHIAKLFPKSDCSAFDAFGRVFSGTVRPGDKARQHVLDSTAAASRIARLRAGFVAVCSAARHS